MDWFHCSRCFRQDGTRFAITNCGHILCEGCGGTGPCPVCATACRYLPLSQQMRPQEKVFFKSPVAIALKHLAHVTQVWRFQLAQAQLLMDSHRDRARWAQAELEKAREELGERRRELESLRRENAELRRIQLSPGWRWSSHSSTPRPSPTQSVTPQPRRQLSSQVVSRSAPLEPPQSRSTPRWQVGIAYRDAGTPLASSVGTPKLQGGTPNPLISPCTDPKLHGRSPEPPKPPTGPQAPPEKPLSADPPLWGDPKSPLTPLSPLSAPPGWDK